MSLRTVFSHLLRGDQDTRIRATWRGIAPLIIGFIAILLGLLAVRGISEPILKTAEATIHSTDSVTLLLNGLVALGGTIIALLVASRFDHRSLPDYGLTITTRELKDVFGGVLIGCLMTGVPMAGMYALGYLRVTEFFSSPDTGLLVTTVIIGFALLGFGLNVVFEEVVFRSIMIQNFVDGLSTRLNSPIHVIGLALVGHAVIFGVWHIILPGGGGVDGRSLELVISSGINGTVWAGAYVLTGRLSLPIGIHLGYNLWNGMVVVPQEVNVNLPSVVHMNITVGSTPLQSYTLAIVRFVIGIGAILLWLYITRSDISINQQIMDTTGRTTSEQTM